MRIESKNNILLDQLYGDLYKEQLPVSKDEKEVERGQGALTIAVIIALVEVGLHGIDTFINVLKYFDDKHKSDENHYIHLIHKDGRVIKLEKLSKDERDFKLELLREKTEDFLLIKVG